MSKNKRNNKSKTKLAPKIKEVVLSTEKYVKKKNGKIKVKGDKERTLVEQGKCLHWGINKKTHKPQQNIVMGTNKDGENVFYCKRCGAEWKVDLPDKDEVKDTTDRMAELNNRFKFLGVHMNIEDVACYTSALGGQIARYPVVAKKVIKVVAKNNQKKNAHRNKGGNGGYSQNNVGGWYAQ